MSPATLTTRLLRRGAASSSSPLRALTRRAPLSSGPAPLPRCLPAVASSSSHWTAARRFLASQSPASSSPSKVSADDNLRRVIDSEIECVVQSEESTADKAIDLPDDFPFEIIDNPGDQSIILKREFAGETIKCAVYTNFDTEEDLNEDDEDDNDEDSFKPAIQMVVTVQKAEGPILEFDCHLNDDELSIENFKMVDLDENLDAENLYTGPSFSVLDESLKKALHRYLEVRGVKHSLHDWLYEYMMHKDEKEYVGWLKSMKEFIGN